MTKSLGVGGFLLVCLVTGFLPPETLGQADGDALTLVPPNNVRVFAQMNSDRTSFVNYLFWEDVPQGDATLVHQPDTAGWHRSGSVKPPGVEYAQPMSGGAYTGTVDLTVAFLVRNNGEVGVGGFYPLADGSPNPSIIVRYNVIGLEFLTNVLDIGAGYTPGEPLECVFKNTNDGSTLDLGFTVSFEPGWADSNGVFVVGLEDFEGYHMYRALYTDGRDAVNIGEVSKQEAFSGVGFDLLYFADMIPSLRDNGYYEFPVPIPGLGSEIDIRRIHPNRKLGANEFFWVDRNAFNGFTYHYLVTTFDRGYNIKSASQGSVKCDHCCWYQGPDRQEDTCPCDSCGTEEIVSVSTELVPQADLPKIYAVPNPYRSGSSQYTTQNYHNYPDNKLRFFNVPAKCALKIYTVAGDLVWEVSQTDGTGNIEWDTRNRRGEEVSSGVYVYRLESASGNWVYGRIVIIR